jgi:predicted nucleic acid-binding protein
VIAIDTNILIELMVSSTENHVQSMTKLRTLGEAIATTHINIAETIRLTSHPKIFPSPLKMADAVRKISELLQSFRFNILELAPEWWQDLESFVREEMPELKGNDIFDLEIALCLKYNGVKNIWTKDSDFLKFPFLTVV